MVGSLGEDPPARCQGQGNKQVSGSHPPLLLPPVAAPCNRASQATKGCAALCPTPSPSQSATSPTPPASGKTGTGLA